jgi:hypothetical protein
MKPYNNLWEGLYQTNYTIRVFYWVLIPLCDRMKTLYPSSEITKCSLDLRSSQTIKSTVLWDVTLYNLIEAHWPFGWTFCFHHPLTTHCQTYIRDSEPLKKKLTLKMITAIFAETLENLQISSRGNLTTRTNCIIIYFPLGTSNAAR